MTTTPTPHAWLWPDRTIGKRESRILREEHNEAINQRAELLLALGLILDKAAYKLDGSEPEMQAINKIARAAIAIAKGE